MLKIFQKTVYKFELDQADMYEGQQETHLPGSGRFLLGVEHG